MLFFLGSSIVPESSALLCPSVYNTKFLVQQFLSLAVPFSLFLPHPTVSACIFVHGKALRLSVLCLYIFLSQRKSLICNPEETS